MLISVESFLETSYLSQTLFVETAKAALVRPHGSDITANYVLLRLFLCGNSIVPSHFLVLTVGSVSAVSHLNVLDLYCLCAAKTNLFFY